MELIEVKPPYNIDCFDSDYENPNIWDVKLWEQWLESIDYYKVSWTLDLISSEESEVTEGHRGVRIGKKHESCATWYYNVGMGYKIKDND